MIYFYKWKWVRQRKLLCHRQSDIQTWGKSGSRCDCYCAQMLHTLQIATIDVWVIWRHEYRNLDLCSTAAWITWGKFVSWALAASAGTTPANRIRMNLLYWKDPEEHLSIWFVVPIVKKRYHCICHHAHLESRLQCHHSFLHVDTW